VGGGGGGGGVWGGCARESVYSVYERAEVSLISERSDRLLLCMTSVWGGYN